jgi:hypothetical protein
MGVLIRHSLSGCGACGYPLMPTSIPGTTASGSKRQRGKAGCKHRNWIDAKHRNIPIFPYQEGREISRHLDALKSSIFPPPEKSGRQCASVTYEGFAIQQLLHCHADTGQEKLLDYMRGSNDDAATIYTEPAPYKWAKSRTSSDISLMPTVADKTFCATSVFMAVLFPDVVRSASSSLIDTATPKAASPPRIRTTPAWAIFWDRSALGQVAGRRANEPMTRCAIGCRPRPLSMHAAFTTAA